MGRVQNQISVSKRAADIWDEEDGSFKRAARHGVHMPTPAADPCTLFCSAQNNFVKILPVATIPSNNIMAAFVSGVLDTVRAF